MKHPQCEDESEWINLQQFKEECRKSSKEMIYAGTDYGVVTMSTTVSMTDGQYKRHLELYNKYACLEVDPLPQEEQESIPILRKPFRVTAGEIEQRSLSRKHARKRKRRKKGRPDVQAAEDRLGQHSMKLTQSVDQVMQSRSVGLECRDILRSFYFSTQARKESRTQEMITSKVYDQIAAKERKYVVQAAKGETAPPILCIGKAGTGVGLRIGGHTKRGGTKMRQRHRRYTIVSMTNEHRSSQTCVFCFQQVQRPKTRKLVKGKWKSVSVNGSSLCMNPQCLAYRHGCNTRNRDTQAAFAIALAGVSRISTGQTLEPFNASHFKTGSQLSHRSPPENGA